MTWVFCSALPNSFSSASVESSSSYRVAYSTVSSPVSSGYFKRVSSSFTRFSSHISCYCAGVKETELTLTLDPSLVETVIDQGYSVRKIGDVAAVLKIPDNKVELRGSYNDVLELLLEKVGLMVSGVRPPKLGFKGYDTAAFSCDAVTSCSLPASFVSIELRIVSAYSYTYDRMGGATRTAFNTFTWPTSCQVIAYPAFSVKNPFLSSLTIRHLTSYVYLSGYSIKKKYTALASASPHVATCGLLSSITTHKCCASPAPVSIARGCNSSSYLSSGQTVYSMRRNTVTCGPIQSSCFTYPASSVTEKYTIRRAAAFVSIASATFA